MSEIKEEITQTIENKPKVFDFGQLTLSTSKSISRASGEAGVMTIINSKRNGRRITFPASVIKRLGDPESVQFAFLPDKIVVSHKLPDNENSLCFRKDGNKYILYASELVHEITEMFGLDFNDRVSITFHGIDYINDGDYPIALITVEQ
jgi:hypothetical protein